MDDKAVIPVGPDCPVATGVCGHNPLLVSADSLELLPLDHGFAYSCISFIAGNIL